MRCIANLECKCAQGESKELRGQEVRFRASTPPLPRAGTGPRPWESRVRRSGEERRRCLSIGPSKELSGLGFRCAGTVGSALWSELSASAPAPKPPRSDNWWGGDSLKRNVAAPLGFTLCASADRDGFHGRSEPRIFCTAFLKSRAIPRQIHGGISRSKMGCPCRSLNPSSVVVWLAPTSSNLGGGGRRASDTAASAVIPSAS
ncbi:hypothetical protein VUR80DRAFT_7771 [Thermomyces stellatus]